MTERTLTQEEENFLALFSELRPGRKTHVLSLVDDLFCSQRIVDNIRAEDPQVEISREFSGSSPAFGEVIKMLDELAPPPSKESQNTLQL